MFAIAVGNDSPEESPPISSCIVCGNKRPIPVFEAFHHRIMECSQCGLAFTAGRSGEKPDIAAPEKYFHEAHEYAESLIDQAKHCPSADHLDIVRQVMAFTGKRDGHVLDAGCAAGALLAAFQQSDWRITGVEPSAEMSSFAARRLGCAIHRETMECCELPAEAFDAITAMHVIEHSPDPELFLRRCRDSLKHDGILLLEVPDFGSHQARRCGRRWRPLYPDSHRFHFTSATLERLLERCGFRAIHVQRLGGLGIIPEARAGTAPVSESPLSNPQRFVRWIFEHRRIFTRSVVAKRLLRHAYWQVLGMNEYFRMTAVKIGR